MARQKRRTPDEHYEAAVEKLVKARKRNATVLNLGERRLSLTRLPPLDGLPSLRSLTLSQTGITDLSALRAVSRLDTLDISHTPVSDITPLAILTRLRVLNLFGTEVTDLSPIAGLSRLTHLDLRATPVVDISPLRKIPLSELRVWSDGIQDFSPLGDLVYLTRLDLSSTSIRDLTLIQNLRKLIVLDLRETEVIDLSPLSNLHGLQHLDLRQTKVADLGAIRALSNLAGLDISETQVRDLSPIATMVSLWRGAAQRGWYYGFFSEGGISFRECPIADPKLKSLASKKNPKRTRAAIDYLRELQGLPKIVEGEVETAQDDNSELQPIENVPAPYVFSVSDAGTISLAANPGNWPTLPFHTSERDHTQRLDACKALANDLLSDLNGSVYQARQEYSHSSEKYTARLPTRPGEGNVLLADAEARTLRNLFAAEVDILSGAFASKLKTFLEQHMGLRVFYPEIANFYRDVQKGHLEAPLPLDAVQGFVRGVQANTPAVFEPNVSDAIQGTAEPPVVIPTLDRLAAVPQDTGQPTPPPDPLGNVDPESAWDFTFAGTANGLWRAFLEGSKVYAAAAAWKKAGEAIAPHAHEILKWLYDFMNSSGGPPSLLH